MTTDRPRPRMTREQINRLRRLLWMKYKPAEIAQEIGCNVQTIYKSYIPAGCPSHVDDNGHIWIVGTEFARWAREQFVRKERQRLAGDQAWCMRCKQPVRMVGPEQVKRQNRYVEIVTRQCARCGGPVAKTRKHDQP